MTKNNAASLRRNDAAARLERGSNIGFGDRLGARLDGVSKGCDKSTPRFT
jgi:hypothetical protein